MSLRCVWSSPWCVVLGQRVNMVLVDQEQADAQSERPFLRPASFLL